MYNIKLKLIIVHNLARFILLEKPKSLVFEIEKEENINVKIENCECKFVIVSGEINTPAYLP